MKISSYCLKTRGVINLCGYNEGRRPCQRRLFFEVGPPDKAVIMLSSRRAAVLKYKGIDAFGKLGNDFSLVLIVKIHKGDDVEIAVAHVYRDRIDEVVVGKNFV